MGENLGNERIKKLQNLVTWSCSIFRFKNGIKMKKVFKTNFEVNSRLVFLFFSQMITLGSVNYSERSYVLLVFEIV